MNRRDWFRRTIGGLLGIAAAPLLAKAAAPSGSLKITYTGFRVQTFKFKGATVVRIPASGDSVFRRHQLKLESLEPVGIDDGTVKPIEGLNYRLPDGNSPFTPVVLNAKKLTSPIHAPHGWVTRDA